MPSTAVNSYFWHFAFVVPSPVCMWVCVRILPRVGTNKVKSQSDKHICYIYYILNLSVCVSARTKNWAKYWQSQNNWNFLACGKFWTERGGEREKEMHSGINRQTDKVTRTGWTDCPPRLKLRLWLLCCCWFYFLLSVGNCLEHKKSYNFWFISVLFPNNLCRVFLLFLRFLYL